MKLYSTNNTAHLVSLKEAVFKGLPEDKGLYMPTIIPTLPDSFFKNIEQYSFQDIGFEVSKALLQGSISDSDLRTIIDEAINFDAPLVSIDKQTHVLELFHGPSLAFKDFGARFMSRLMSHLGKEEKEDLTILVATSGDTGGAVASGFHKTPGIKVIILYPSGKVSPLQEKQLTTLGHNITALEVDGTFDDCQALVKKAFLDTDITSKKRLSSANSINIARLIPQSFYYFEAWKQLKDKSKKVVFSIPSGNFGNLTAGLFAQRMGLPIHQFIAATNINDVVPEYIETGIFTPRPSVRTISNAMDVGNPSNFSRIKDLFKCPDEDANCSTWNIIKEKIKGYSYNDDETRVAMKDIFTSNYTIDPHGAVGYLALKEYQKTNKGTVGIVLETAHPSKFLEEMESTLGVEIDIPERLSKLKDKQKVAHQLDTNYQNFKDFILSHS